MITAAHLQAIRPGTAHADAELAARVLSVAAQEYGITTRLRLAAWLANIAHECGFRNVRESVYYTDAARMARIFLTAFQGSAAAARPYVRNEIAAANRVYANRLGNGNEASGDGWAFRGAGYIQLTGRNLFAAYSPVGVDLARHPERIDDPVVSARTAANYWVKRGCNVPADAGDIDGTRRMVNGAAMLGVEEVRVYYRRALAVLPGVQVAKPAAPAVQTGVVPLLGPDGAPLPGFGRARIMTRTDGQGLKVVAVPDGKEI